MIDLFNLDLGSKGVGTENDTEVRSMEAKNYVGWGIMGLGNIAEDFVRSMEKIHPIQAVASRNGDRARKFKEKYHVVRAYEGYDDFLCDPKIDIVYVATVNSAHYRNIRACLMHGKNVLCEKAILSNTAELKELEVLAKERNLFFFEAMTIYHMPIMKKIKGLIAEGHFGEIKMIRADFGSLQVADPNNRFFSKELGGGAMLDIGTYALSFIRYFMEGDLEEMACTTSPYSTGVDEMWSISMKSSKEVLASACLTFRAKLPKVAIISGDKGYVLIPNYPRAEIATIYYPDGTSYKLSEGSTSDAMKYEIEDVEGCFRSGDHGGGHYEETRDVVDWMERLLGENGYL